MIVSDKPRIELLNVDCMEYMATVPDKYFDLAIVDPPYGIGDFSQSDRKYNGDILWNDNKPNEEYFLTLKRVSKNQIIWGANYYNCFDFGAIVWDKLNMHPSMSRCEIASYSGQKKVDYYQYEWHGYVVKRIDPESFHPCAKPVALYKWLLHNYAKEGDKILDTHGGSMSSAIACHQMGFDLTLCELDKDYYEAGVKRFKEQTLQQSLFK